MKKEKLTQKSSERWRGNQGGVLLARQILAWKTERQFWPGKLSGKKINQGQKPALETRIGHELLQLN
jgi:hypothetical protein